MKTINANEIANLLRKNKSTFVSLVTETDPKFLKGRGANSFENVVGKDASKYRKVAKLVGLVGTSVDYGTLVENRASKVAGDTVKVETEGRRWGERVDGVEVQHKGKSYITLHFVANNKPQISYKYDGKEIELDKEKDFIPKKKVSSTQTEAGLTEENQIVYRDYDCESIKAITVSGETYIVV